MNPFAVLLAICWLATAQAKPGYLGSSEKLQSVPDGSGISKLSYPTLDILDLGHAVKDQLPPSVITITKKEIVKEPHPYPVKVPYPVPHPYPVAKPYPVIQTKYVKIPHPVPYEVVKKVPVPIEVPKPFPVPHEEFSQGASGGGGGGGHSFGGSFTGHDGGFGGGEGGGQGGYGGGFEGSEHSGGYAEADQSADYQVQANQVGGWVPVGGESQQAEEQQH